MRLVGSFRVSEFENVVKQHAQIHAGAKTFFKIEYLRMIGTALLYYGRHLPVLTGDLRSDIKTILFMIDYKIVEAGGNSDFASGLDTETMTESLLSSGVEEPQPLSDLEYKKKFKHRPSQTQYQSRREWRFLTIAYGHTKGQYSPTRTFAVQVHSNKNFKFHVGFNGPKRPPEVKIAMQYLAWQFDKMIEEAYVDFGSTLAQRQANLKQAKLSVFLSYGILNDGGSI